MLISVVFGSWSFSPCYHSFPGFSFILYELPCICCHWFSASKSISHRSLLQLQTLPESSESFKVIIGNGPQFALAEFQLFLEEQGIKLLIASVFNPPENRLMECWNRTLKHEAALLFVGSPWNDGIQELLSQHCHMPMTVQGPSPTALFFRCPTCPAFEIACTLNEHADVPHACEQSLNTDSACAAPCSTTSIFRNVADSGSYQAPTVPYLLNSLILGTTPGQRQFSMIGADCICCSDWGSRSSLRLDWCRTGHHPIGGYPPSSRCWGDPHSS